MQAPALHLRRGRRGGKRPGARRRRGQQEPAHADARPRSFIDCSGDGDIAIAAGAPFEKGDAAKGELQPVTLMFRMMGVEPERAAALRAGASREFRPRRICRHSGLTAAGMRRRRSTARACRSCSCRRRPGDARRDRRRRDCTRLDDAASRRYRSRARKSVVNTTRIGHLDATRTDQAQRTRCPI